MQVISIISMDVFNIFFPKVLCLIIDSYIARCHDCNTNLIDDYTCISCNRIRCQYCNYINANTQVCVECQGDSDFTKTADFVMSCIDCGDDAYYGITDEQVAYCYKHAPNNVTLNMYGDYCSNYCVGTAMFVDEYKIKYCTKHAKSCNKTLTRYTIIKNGHI